MRLLRLSLPLIVALTACGQTGPLVLPEQTMAPPPAFEPVIVTPPRDDDAEVEREREDDAPEQP